MDKNSPTVRNSATVNTTGKAKKFFTLLGAYSFFMKNNPEYRNLKSTFSQKEYTDICKDFNKRVVEEILNGGEYKMPFRMGNIRIMKAKTKMTNMKIDFGHLRKTGEKIYHLNKHSDGYRARWYWGKKNCNVKHKSFYCFKPSRTNKTSLAAAMHKKDGHKIYQTY